MMSASTIRTVSGHLFLACTLTLAFACARTNAAEANGLKKCEIEGLNPEKRPAFDVNIKTDDTSVSGGSEISNSMNAGSVSRARQIHSGGTDVSVAGPWPLIVVASDAPAVEQQAAKLLASWCGRLPFGERGAFGELPIVTPAVAAKAKNKTQFAVGASATAALGLLASDLSFDKLGGDGFVLTSNRTALLRSAPAGSVALSGAPNSTGTIYAAQHLLRLLGIKFLAWDQTLLPAVAHPSSDVDLTFVPHFEYRNTYGWASEATPAIHQLFHQTASPYASPPGMVHTSYSLFGPAHPPASGKSNCDAQQCPPADLFKQHPEWFWPRGNGKSYGQLCWSNASLIDFIAERATEMLAKQPNAKVISMSQNDNGNFCKSPEELAIIKAEGSPMGPLLLAVNAIAKKLAPHFPHIAVDTLAYQYTQPPPTSGTKPEPNVIIRLCDISSNSGALLTDPSNAVFSKIISDWFKLTQRIWIWNYVVDFGNYVQSFPNYYVIGPNTQFFAQHGVMGMFQEGPGQGAGDGTDMEELKDYVMASMLWDPTLDPDTLIAEFLSGYYGSTASPFIRLYMDTMHDSVVKTNDTVVACCMPPPAGVNKAYLTPDALLTSAKAFTDASAALSKEDNDKSGVYEARVARARMANLYTVLWRWDELRTFASNRSMTWPMAEVTQQTAYNWFATEYNKTGTKQLTIDRSGPTKAGGDLLWLHACLFATCPGGGGDDQIYAEVVVDECSSQLASDWTAVPSSSGGTVFRSALSTDMASGSGRCLALNIPGDSKLTSGNQVVVRSATTCGADATECSMNNVFSCNVLFLPGSGLLATPKGFTTTKCTTKDGCCIQASKSNGNLSMVSCDKTNANQQWKVESLVKGTPGQIRDKATGLRCLSLKKCEIEGLNPEKRPFDANIKTDDTSVSGGSEENVTETAAYGIPVWRPMRLPALLDANRAALGQAECPTDQLGKPVFRVRIR